MTFGTADLADTTVTTLTYDVVDNGPLDDDPRVGYIIDPVGVAEPAANVGLGNLNLPSLQALEGVSDPSLAFGLSGIADWGAQMPFLNIMKSSRQFSGARNAFGDVPHEELVEGGYLDENGWPMSIPDGVQNIGAVWSWNEKMVVMGLKRYDKVAMY